MKMQAWLGLAVMSLMSFSASAEFNSAVSCDSKVGSSECIPNNDVPSVQEISQAESSAVTAGKIPKGSFGCWISSSSGIELCISDLVFNQFSGFIDFRMSVLQLNIDDAEFRNIRLNSVSFVHDSSFVTVVAAGRYGKEEIPTQDGNGYEFYSRITLVLVADKDGNPLRVDSIKIDHGTYTENFTVR